MSWLAYLAAAVFLPLFPFSMLFNRVYAALRNAWLRAILLLVWPQLGILAVAALGGAVSSTLIAYWAVFTALLYAFRALTLRDLTLWTAYMATSVWALLWPLLLFGGGEQVFNTQVAVLSAPFIMLAWVAARLEVLFGGAYADTYGGLAQALPRLSLVLVLAILAAISTPLFPGFFAMLATVTRTLAELPAAVPFILLVWLLWAWAGARMTRGLVVGPVDTDTGTDAKADLGVGGVALPVLLMALLAATGLATSGYLI